MMMGQASRASKELS